MVIENLGETRASFDGNPDEAFIPAVTTQVSQTSFSSSPAEGFWGKVMLAAEKGMHTWLGPFLYTYHCGDICFQA